ncbi:MAG: vitamin K epoxide reductase family protein [Rhodopirellula sp. JB055]|uniref:vitamin K epoxide reductase family protein n=1 Tax=Rhodopirellula sp. JB055 TaxID=3342846 RepID=UPI00370A9949
MRFDVPVDDLNRPVPPYEYNPSAWSQRIPICVCAFIAAAISVHLSLYQWGLIESAYDPVFDDGSNKVLKSDTANTMYAFLGIHDAALGVLAYLGDAILGFAGSTRRWQYRPWLVVLFGIDVIPLGIVSVVLVLCQAFLVGEWCFLCLITAAISLTLVYWAWDEVRVSLTFLHRIWKAHHDKRLLWNSFWGLRSERADTVAEKLLSREVT